VWRTSSGTAGLENFAEFRSTSIVFFSPLLETASMMPSPIAITTPIAVQTGPIEARTPDFQRASRPPIRRTT
jgi:hypothetical protein